MDILLIYLHNLTVLRTKQTAAFSHYLPIEEDARRWGLYVIDAGSEVIPAGSPYPSSRHPKEYLFAWDKGRTLDEYQLVYISRGRGVFESKATGRVRIDAGQVFLLFPGVWHRYRPVSAQGWDENWIGFNGDIARRIMGNFFPPEKAVIRIGEDLELLDVFRSVASLMQQAPPGYQQLMAGRAMEALALVRSRSLGYHAGDREVSRKVQQARYFLLEHSAEDIDLDTLARQLGLSYSRFRSIFKEHTGAAPHQYQLDIRINKARNLLNHTSLPVTEIAGRVGFTSVYYFSRLFKKREGCPPRAYREK